MENLLPWDGDDFLFNKGTPIVYGIKGNEVKKNGGQNNGNSRGRPQNKENPEALLFSTQPSENKYEKPTGNKYERATGNKHERPTGNKFQRHTGDLGSAILNEKKRAATQHPKPDSLQTVR